MGSNLVMTADVFGFTTSAHNDIGIGQLWEDFIGLVDVALPMVYPSHYWPGVFNIDDPNGHPYEGEFRDGKFHGYGIYTWAGGLRFEGTWQNNQKWTGK